MFWPVEAGTGERQKKPNNAGQQARRERRGFHSHSHSHRTHGRHNKGVTATATYASWPGRSPAPRWGPACWATARGTHSNRAVDKHNVSGSPAHGASNKRGTARRTHAHRPVRQGVGHAVRGALVGRPRYTTQLTPQTATPRQLGTRQPPPPRTRSCACRTSTPKRRA